MDKMSNEELLEEIIARSFLKECNVYNKNNDTKLWREFADSLTQ